MMMNYNNYCCNTCNNISQIEHINNNNKASCCTFQEVPTNKLHPPPHHDDAAAAVCCCANVPCIKQFLFHNTEIVMCLSEQL